MIQIFKHRWNRIAIRIAVGSFVIGTLLMLLALMATNDFSTTIGFLFLIFYIPITLILLCILFINTMANFKDINEHTLTFIIVLMNFPIAILYTNFITI